MSEILEDTIASPIKLEGAFVDSLKRKNARIREDRATAIGEDAQMIYKRQCEDISLLIRAAIREQENMLDLSADDTHSLKMAENFDAAAYVDKDIALSVKIRNLKIKYELALARYNHLFTIATTE